MNHYKTTSGFLNHSKEKQQGRESCMRTTKTTNRSEELSGAAVNQQQGKASDKEICWGL